MTNCILALPLVGALVLGASSPTEVEARAVQAAQTPQITPSSPELERRDQPVTEEDLRILAKAEDLLKDETAWNRQDDRKCDDDESAGKRSLFCALQKACIDVSGKYDHRRVALQEVRFAILDVTGGRKFEHRLKDFNNLPETQLVDVKKVLQIARERIAARLPKS